MEQNLRINFNNIKLVHSSPYHQQTNGVFEDVHKEIKKYIFSEYFKNKKNFDIENELFNITKIQIKDIEDIKEIEEINKEIINILLKKYKNFDIIDYNKSYVIDYNKIYIKNDRILKKKVKFKKSKKQIKFPLKLLVSIIVTILSILLKLKKNITISKL